MAEAFIHQQNVAHYRRQLDTASDPARLAMLNQLLAEELAHLERLEREHIKAIKGFREPPLASTTSTRPSQGDRGDRQS